MIKLSLQTQTLQRLCQLIKPQSNNYDFLGLTLNLETCSLTDSLNSSQMKNLIELHLQLLVTLLTHYSVTNSAPLTGKFIKFKDLPGGNAYESAFDKRAIQPVADVFGEKPDEMPKAAKSLGGLQRNFGDSSFEVEALKGVPLTYILWGTDEFPASASLLYDQSASNYLPTEDLAVLGELTTSRLILAKKILNAK